MPSGWPVAGIAQHAPECARDCGWGVCSAVVNYAKDGAPALLFVPTRWHCRHAALELLTFAAADGHPKRFLQVREPSPPGASPKPSLLA